MIIFRPGFLQCCVCGTWTDTAFALIGHLDQYCAKHTPMEGRTHEEQSSLLSSLVNPNTWSPAK